mgnify:CR=1 FL=1
MTPSTPVTQLAFSDKFNPSGDADRNRYNRLVALVPLTDDEELAKITDSPDTFIVMRKEHVRMYIGPDEGGRCWIASI